MPFVVRTVEPRNLGRGRLHDQSGRPILKDGELEAVSNATLANALRQLASVARIAEEIFQELNAQLTEVTERSSRLKTRIGSVQEKVSKFDPKAVTVPESDLTEFWALKNHYKCRHEVTKGLFTVETRPEPVQRLYELAAGGSTLSDSRRERLISVSPVLGKRRTNLPLDIETRKPAALRKLRRWTSTEALGSITVEPDTSLRVVEPNPDTTDHTLPSPEEQLQAIVLKFPAEVVKVDITGKSFERMSNLRRSMINSEYDDAVRRRTKTKKPRGKRRNTIAGTDSKELAAIVGESSDTNMGKSTPEGTILCPEKKSHLENLKEWGRSRLRQIKNMENGVRLRSVSSSRRKWDKDEPNPHSSSGNWSASSESGQSTATSHVPRSSASSGSGCTKNKKFPIISTSSSVTSESTLTPDEGETSSMYSCDTEGYYTSFHLDSGLKTLREEEPCTPLHSTSALSVNSQSNNQSAESEYELFGKGSTSTTASSAGTVCTTLLVPPAPSVPERVSSQLSGNKTLPERTTRSHDTEKRETQSLKLSKHVDMKMLTFDEIKKMNESKSNLTKENISNHEQKIENKNCIITVDVHHGRDTTPEKCGDSPDSGHNTCSSPVDSVASPSLDLELSECSDLEGVDRMERIREKTTINSSRIPSMCVITPPQSDDEVSLTHSFKPEDSGEYVTIAEIRGSTSTNPVVPSPILKRETEYISLNDLPNSEGLSEPKRQGARVTLNAEGKVVYSSDSLRRRKSVHTTRTFEPGPYVSRNENSPVPQRHINVRPINVQSPLFANRKIITPSPVQKSQPNTPCHDNKEVCNNSARQPLSLVNRAISPQSQRRDISNQKQYFTKSDIDKNTTTSSSRPLSPLVSPTNHRNFMRNSSSMTPSNRATSPRMIVKAKTGIRAISPTQSRGAYVRVNQPSPPDDSKLVVKRSDSYRIANEETVFNPNSLGRKQYGPGVIAGPSLISAIHAARNNKAPDEQNSNEFSRSFEDATGSSGQLTWPRSTSTPTKSNESPPLNFSTTSPISNNVTPNKNSRSAMDLYAVIHESKKRIQSLQKPLPQQINWPKAIPAKSVAPVTGSLDNNIPKPMAPLQNINQQRYVKQTNIGYGSLPRLQVQTLEESPRNLQRKVYTRQNNDQFLKSYQNPERSSLASDRHGPTQPTSRNDFKRLLLQTAWGSNPRGSAVERLKNKGLKQSLKPLSHDVLSSTILEDCDDEDEQEDQVTERQKLTSSSLVNHQDKKFKTKSLTTLETAL